MSAAAARAPEQEPVQDSVAAPRVVWAKPHREGALRVLLVTPRFALRDAVELAERFDLDLRTCATWDSGHLGYDPSLPQEHLAGYAAEEVADRLDRLIEEKLDAVIVAGCECVLLPPAWWKRLEARVAEGMGLVVCHGGLGENLFETPCQVVQTGPGAILRGIGPCGERGLPDVRTLRCGEGRIALIAYAGGPPANHGLVAAPTSPIRAYRSHFDNGLSLVARALTWVSRRTPAARIDRVEFAGPTGPREEEIPPDQPGATIASMRDTQTSQPLLPYRLHLDAPADRRYDVMFQLRREDLDLPLPTLNDDTPLPKGETAHAFQLFAGAGTYLLDVWLSDRRGVADWYTQEIVVPGWPDFQDLRFSKSHVLRNDVLDLSFTVRPILSASRACTLYARAIESLRVASGQGRLVAEASDVLPSEGGEVALRLQLADLQAPLILVEVYALDGSNRGFGGLDLAGAYREAQYFPVRGTPPKPDFALGAMAPQMDEANARFYLGALAEAGFRMVYGPAEEAALLRAGQAGLALVPELGCYAAEAAVDGVRRSPCLRDAAYRTREVARIEASALEVWARPGRLYSLGDANCLCASEENVCQSSHCLEALRASLAESYGSLDGLNRAWETDFGAWSDLSPPETAFGGGTAAAHVDFRTAMDAGFAAFHHEMAARVRTVDRTARTGFIARAGDHPMYGYAWAPLLGGLDWLAAPPDPVVMAKLRSYRGGKDSIGIVLDMSARRPSEGLLRWAPWLAALEGFDHLWCRPAFGSTEDAAAGAILLPDGRPGPEASLLLAAAAPLGDGLARLLRAAAPAPRSVAIVESRASRHLNDADSRFGCTSHEAEAVFIRAFGRLGIPFEFVDEDGLAGASLAAYRLLVLPMCRALDDAAVASVMGFVARGGTVLADVAPATHDEHGAPCAVPALDAIFGIARGNAGMESPSQDSVGRIGSDGDIVVLPGLTVDTAVHAETAQAWGSCGDGTGLWFYHEPGAGAAILMNHAAPALGTPDTWHTILDVVCEAADVSALSPKPSYKDEVFPGRQYAFSYGKASIHALLSDADSAGKIRDWRMPFPKDRHVYALPAGEAVLRPKKASVRLEPGDGAVLTSLPYAVTAVTVASAQVASAGRRIEVAVAIQAEGEDVGEHLVAVDLVPEFTLTPEGRMGVPGKYWIPEARQKPSRRLRHYRRYVRCVKGAGKTYLPLAKNETPGPYRIVARDLLTGVTGEFRVAIGGPVGR